MQSTDFRSLISPVMTGAKPIHRKKGGPAKAEAQPKHHVTVIIPIIHPAIGALTHALMLHHAQQALRGRR